MVLYGLIAVTGVLVGLEIPILMRILKDRYEFKDLISRVFTFDYIGALIASLVFPLLLIPYLGLIRTAYLFGMMNVLIALLACISFRSEVKHVKALKTASVISLLALLTGFIYANWITSFSEGLTYSDTIIFSKSTPYQRIIITKKGRDLRLFLNGNLQFSSVDEYRYHEALIHPVLQAVPDPKNILVMGGGDGLAVREILKYPQIQTVTLVDLDKGMTRLFRTNEMLLALNKRSLLNPKVTVINADAFSWARAQNRQYDAIIVDFPDPSNYSVGKLYTDAFYKIVKRLLKPDGIMVVQSTSPYVAPKSYWTVEKTLQSVGLHTVPYHNYVPSFGEWGYIMAMYKPVYKVPDHYLPGLRFMSKSCLEQMLFFPKDMTRVPASVNKLNNQILVKYFEDEWSGVL